jgi:predicted Holliday junction resolvase-like endonuclease
VKRNPLTIQSLLLFIYHLSQLLAQREAEIVQLKQKLAEYERTIEKQEKKEDMKEVTTPSGMKPPYEKKNKKKK